MPPIHEAQPHHEAQPLQEAQPLRGTILAVASFLAFGALLVLYGANASELIETLGLDYEEFGRVGAMLSLGLGVGIIAAGPLVDRLPRRPLFLAACGLVLVATTTLGPDSSYGALLAHTVAIGFGAGFYETVLNALIVEDLGPRAPRRLIFVHAAATAAASATPLLFEFLRGLSPLFWYDTFRMVGTLHAFLILGALFVPMGAPRAFANEVETTNHPASTRRDDRRSLYAVCLACFAYVGVEAAATLFVADHATSVLGLGEERAARTISAFWGGLLVGRLAIGLSPRPIGGGTIAALAAVAAGFFVLFGQGWISSPEMAMAVIGFFLGGVFPVMIGLAGIALPSSPGLAVGLAGGLGSLGGFVVPWVTGVIAQSTSLSFGLMTQGGWLALLVAGAVIAGRRLETT